MNTAQPWYMRMIFAVLRPVDWIIDCHNLFRNGFGYADGKWFKRIILTDGELDIITFSSRRRAVEHMQNVLMSRAVKEAIKNIGTNFSGKSRNAMCLCGSGKKFKYCCMTEA